MGGFTLGVYDSVTNRAINGATCNAYVFPLDILGNPVSNPVGGKITKTSSGDQGVAFDRTDFGIWYVGLGFEYHWDLNAEGYNGVAGYIRVPGDEWGHDSAKMVAAPVPVIAEALPAPSEKTTQQIVADNVAGAGDAISDVIKNAGETLTKPLTEIGEQTKKLLILAGIVIGGLILIYAFTRQSPSPAERVQIRTVRVGEAGFDPATRRIGAKDVEVAAR